MAPEPPSPSASSALLPFLGGRERRGSLASLTSTKGDINKDVLAQALDDIHTSASKSDVLTSFHDYDGGAPKAGAKEIVSSGVTGLYDKLLRGLGGTPGKDGKGRPKSTASRESVEAASLQASTTRKSLGLTLKSPPPDAASLQSNPSLVPSPVLASFAGSGSQLETNPNETRSDAQKKLMEQIEGRLKTDIDAQR